MAQLVDRAVGDHLAPVHDDDTPGSVAELGKRVRRKDHRRACGAPGLDNVIEIEPQRRVEASWSARPATEPVVHRSTPGPDLAAGACPSSRCQGAGMMQAPRPTRSSNSRACGNRLALEPRVKGEELARGQCWIERDVLRQIAEPPPGSQTRRPPDLRRAPGLTPPWDARDRARASRASSCRPRCGRRARRSRQARGQRKRSRTASTGPYRFVKFCDLNGCRHGKPSWEALRGGVMRGWLSTTPPGRMAGNWLCAQRMICTAGLFVSTFASGAVHSTVSIRSLGR